MSDAEHLFRKDFWRGVGQGEDDRFGRHAGHHLLGDEASTGEAQHHVRPLERVSEVACWPVLSKRCLVFVEFPRIQPRFGDNALTVDERDVGHVHANSHVVVGACNGRRPRPDNDDLEVAQGFLLEFSGVEQRRCGNDGGAVLVVVHHRNIGGFSDSSFNFKTFWGFDVFKIDAAKRLGNVHDGVDEFLRVFGVNLDVKHVNASEGLQEQAFAFHNRLAGKRTNVAQPKDGRSVGNHRHQVAFGGVAIGVFGSLLDFQARVGHTGRVGQTQLVSRGVWFGGHDLDFPLRFSLVVLKRLLAQHLVFFARGQGYPHQKGGEAGFDCCAKLKPS